MNIPIKFTIYVSTLMIHYLINNGKTSLKMFRNVIIYDVTLKVKFCITRIQNMNQCKSKV